MSARILIVEDEQITAEDLRDILGEFGYTVTGVVSNGAAAIECAQRELPDMALMDIRIKGDMDGTETALVLRERFNIPVVYLTAHADPTTSERAKAASPLGYITKPFKQPTLQASIEIALHKHQEDLKATQRERFLSSTLDALGMGALSVRPEALMKAAAERPIEDSMAPNRYDRGNISGTPLVLQDPTTGKTARSGAESGMHEHHLNFGDFTIVAASPVMKQAITFSRRVAESEASTILLEGESGTGKDVMAQFLHHFSKRRNRAFVPLNCAAIPETLLESELFGYEKGAFTDARTPKPGILEMASGGTLFLDEIGEMPVLLQAKMLRVLEQQTFRRLGGVRDIHVDLRLIAASNRNLSDEVKQRTFRLDLYYRLNVIRVMLPPLRQRAQDILPLARYFIGHYNTRFRRNILGISSSATMALLNYDWPGNVRELRNTIERSVLLEESDWIQQQSLCLEDGLADDSAVSRPDHPEQVKSKNTLERAAREMLVDALETTGWNKTRAARVLGVSRDTLRYKVRKYNLAPNCAG